MWVWTILRLPERDSTFGPLEVVVDGAGIECHDENQCSEIQRIVDKSLIEKTDRINKNADQRRHHHGAPGEKVAISVDRL